MTSAGGRNVNVPDLRAYIRSLYDTGTVVGENGREFSLMPSGVLESDGEALRDLAISVNAVRTIETGLCWGLSTLFLCEALLASGRADARHVAIDPFQRGRLSSAGLRALRDGGVAEMVDFHDRVSQLVLPELLAAGGQFDFAFIDGDHRFEGVFLDLYYLDRLVRPNGLIVVDDVWMPSVRTAVQYFVTNVGLEVVPSPFPGAPFNANPPHLWDRVTKSAKPRLCVLRCPPERPRRPWDQFVPFADSGLDGSRAGEIAEALLRRAAGRARPLLRRALGNR